MSCIAVALAREGERLRSAAADCRNGRPPRARIELARTPASPWRSRCERRPGRRTRCSSRPSHKGAAPGERPIAHRAPPDQGPVRPPRGDRASPATDLTSGQIAPLESTTTKCHLSGFVRQPPSQASVSGVAAKTLASTRREQRGSRGSPLPPPPVSSARDPRPHACAAICGPTTVTSGIGCSAHCGGSTPAASAAMRAQWRSKPAGVQTST
jgi:hypothetical protein